MNGGLQNIGNTCAINSLIQCLYSLDILRTILLQQDINNTKTISFELLDIFSKFQQGHSITPNGFVHKLIRVFEGFFVPGEQFDIGELWILLADKISEELNTPIRVNASSKIEEQIYKLNSNKSSDWQNAIQGVNISITKCNSCNKDVFNIDLFTVLTLDLNANIEISEMILSFFKVEDLTEWSCDTCKNKGGRKQYQIYKLPHVLCILIKRFNNNFEKLQNPINIPLDLNFQTDRGQYYYRLKSIGNHFGNYNGGHYNSIVFNETWKFIDDLNIQNIDTDTFSQNNQFAYILFYERA